MSNPIPTSTSTGYPSCYEINCDVPPRCDCLYGDYPFDHQNNSNEELINTCTNYNCSEDSDEHVKLELRSCVREVDDAGVPIKFFRWIYYQVDFKNHSSFFPNSWDFNCIYDTTVNLSIDGSLVKTSSHTVDLVIQVVDDGDFNADAIETKTAIIEGQYDIGVFDSQGIPTSIELQVCVDSGTTSEYDGHSTGGDTSTWGCDCCYTQELIPQETSDHYEECLPETCGCLDISAEFNVDYCNKASETFTLVDAEFRFESDDEEPLDMCEYEARVLVYASSVASSTEELIELNSNACKGYSDSFEIEFDQNLKRIAEVVKNYIVPGCYEKFRVEVELWSLASDESQPPTPTETSECGRYEQISQDPCPTISTTQIGTFMDKCCQTWKSEDILNSIEIADYGDCEDAPACYTCGKDSVTPTDIWIRLNNNSELWMATEFTASRYPMYVELYADYYVVGDDIPFYSRHFEFHVTSDKPMKHDMSIEKYIDDNEIDGSRVKLYLSRF